MCNALNLNEQLEKMNALFGLEIEKNERMKREIIELEFKLDSNRSQLNVKLFFLFLYFI
jgi:hypothetical protein